MAVQEHENDTLVVYNPTNKPFTVKWGGVPRTIEPHQVAKYPRFLAEHMAKHLADFILQVKEYQHKKKHGKEVNYMRNTKERASVMGLVVRGVETYFLPPDATGVQAGQQTAPPTEEELRNTLDLGQVENDAMGMTFDEVEIELPPEARTVSLDSSKQDIIEQLKVLGIDHNPRDSKAVLLKQLGINVPGADVDGVQIDEQAGSDQGGAPVLPDGSVPPLPPAQ